MALSLVYAFLLLGLSQAMIWGPQEGSRRGRGQVHPKIVEISDSKLSEESLSNAANDAIYSTNRRRERRAASNDRIEYIASLDNDSHTQAVVHWTGHPSEKLFILTRRRTRISGYAHSDESWLWRSGDYGHTFHNDTTKWDNDTVIEWYYISPYSQYLVFADVKNSRLYVTRDEGDTYHRYDLSFKPDVIRFQSRYIVNSTDDPYNEYILGYAEQAQELWVSVNLGANWTRISDQVVPGSYYWRVLSDDVENLATVYFEKALNGTLSELYYVVDVNSPSPVLFDQNLGPFMNGTLVVEHEYMFVQKVSTGSSANTYQSPLWVSHNRQSFKQAMFPLHKEEKHYAVVDASENQVFIAVYHDINSTNLYLSEEAGLNYSLSIEYIISPPEESWLRGYPSFDVHVVEGIVGTYVANIKSPNSPYGSTVISYDKGGEWNRLNPPAIDSLGRPIICAQPECSLHIHIASNRSVGYESILSQDTAVGLIMAQGNLGSSLTTNRGNLKLYFSRDGGFTWSEVSNGFWYFQFPALGSIIVTVQKRVLSHNISWSCDEGSTWQQTQFANRSDFYVVGMLTERGEKARHVTIFGFYLFQPKFTWLVVGLNFTSVVPNQCSKDDYFDWVPTDERPGSRCLLGEVITYERRNSSICCYIDPFYDRPVSRTSCTCSVEDFECDFGFQRTNLNSPCSPFPWILWPPPPPSNCQENHNYTISSGYRKVAGDKCVRGEETYFFEKVLACPIAAPLGLFITYTNGIILPQHTVTFTLTQQLGARLSTWYAWNFDDSSTLVNITGYDAAHLQNHSFAQPGTYYVVVDAANAGGSANAITSVTVLDIVNSVSIIPPTQVHNGQVPAGIELLFSVSLRTEHNTNATGLVTYTWDFCDHTQQEHTEQVSIFHEYYNAGEYNISVIAQAPYASVSASYLITVYDSAKHVRIEVSGVLNDDYVKTKVKYTFHVVLTDNIDETIPDDTMYSWHLVPYNQNTTSTSHNQTFIYTFPKYGRYALSVVGNHSAGSFSTQRFFNAENVIDKVDVRYNVGVRAGGKVMGFLQAKMRSLPYLGPLSFNIQEVGGSNLTQTETQDDYDGSTEVSFTLGNELTQSKPLNVMFYVQNHVSNASVTKKVNVFVKGDYGSVRIIFRVENLPQTYNTSQWMDKLRVGVLSFINLTISVSSDRVEIENIRVAVNDTQPSINHESSEPKQHNILRRSGELLLYVEVNILPKSISDADIKQIKNKSKELVIQINTKQLTVEVNGSQIPVAGAEQRVFDSVYIIEPGRTVVKTKLYSGIGGGLGAVLVVGVAVAVILGIVIYFYHRRYNRLRVRYSRLSTNPVRFTFTQSGEMIEQEDEDYDEDTSCSEKPDEQQLKIM